MKYTQLFAVAIVAIWPSCSEKASEKAPEAGTAKAGDIADADAVKKMRTAIKELMAKKEHTAQRVVVQHILIGFKGSVGGKPITRSRDEAEVLAAQLCHQIEGGADFDGLVKKHTDDAYPGRYPMTTASRSGMVAGFGNVGWRLEVGDVGVAPHDPGTSPFGWHIVKRVE